MTKTVVYSMSTGEIDSILPDAPSFSQITDDQDFDSYHNWTSLPDSAEKIRVFEMENLETEGYYEENFSKIREKLLDWSRNTYTNKQAAELAGYNEENWDRIGDEAHTTHIEYLIGDYDRYHQNFRSISAHFEDNEEHTLEDFFEDKADTEGDVHYGIVSDEECDQLRELLPITLEDEKVIQKLLSHPHSIGFFSNHRYSLYHLFDKKLMLVWENISSSCVELSKKPILVENLDKLIQNIKGILGE